jgi:PAS domain S-box-containing protein
MRKNENRQPSRLGSEFDFLYPSSVKGKILSEQSSEVTLRRRVRELEQELDELRRAWEPVAASEALFRMMVQASNSVILTLDPDANITFMNDYGVAFFGYERDEILGRSAVGTIVPEKDRDGSDLSAMVGSLVKEPERFSVNENENIKKNGDRVWIAWTNRAVRDEEGRIREIICIGNDITAHKEAERNLEKTTRQLKERVKELHCLYEISRLRDRPDFSLDGSLQAIVDLIPSAWQHPEIACARIVMEGYEIGTENFRKTDWCLSREIRIGGEKAGEVEVCYLESRPGGGEDPFLNGERQLLKAIAERVGRIIEREWMEEDMRRLR